MPERVPGVFRSKDDGHSWDELPVNVNLNGPISPPRTTTVIVDPRDHLTVWAGVEVAGLYRSKDGGDSWSALPNVGPQMMYDDIHGLAIRPGDPTLVYSTSPFGLAVSTNEGESWDHHKFPSFDPGGSSYCRNILVRPDNPDVMFVGNGNGIPGVTGAVRRTVDGGATWDTPDLPTTPNSVVYCFSAHVDVPDCIAAASVYGYLYLSDDGGALLAQAGAGIRRNPSGGDQSQLGSVTSVMADLKRAARRVLPPGWPRPVLSSAVSGVGLC